MSDTLQINILTIFTTCHTDVSYIYTWHYIITHHNPACWYCVYQHCKQSCILQCRSFMLFQDQRLVGFPSLRFNLPVWSYAHLVSDGFHFSLLYTFTIAVNKKYNYSNIMTGWAPFWPDVVFVLRPEGTLYQMFRNQFLTYCLYQSKRFKLSPNCLLHYEICANQQSLLFRIWSLACSAFKLSKANL